MNAPDKDISGPALGPGCARIGIGWFALFWAAVLPAVELTPPKHIGDRWWVRVETPDEDINDGTRLAVKALWDGAAPKAGIWVPTVCSRGSAYPYWIHPYDNGHHVPLQRINFKLVSHLALAFAKTAGGLAEYGNDLD